MTGLDWIVLVAFLLSMLWGAVRGLVYEVLSLCGWVVAVVVARIWAIDAANMLPISGWDPQLRSMAGFVLLFVLVLFGWGLLSALARRLITAVGLRHVDRALGALFGVLRTVLLLVVLTLVVESTGLRHSGWWREAMVSPWLSSGLALVRPNIPAEWEQYLPKGQQAPEADLQVGV